MRTRYNFTPDPEPTYEPNSEDEYQPGRLLNWYSNNRSSKDAKKYLIEYLERTGLYAEHLPKIKSHKESRVHNTMGWIARILTRAGDAPENYKQHLDEHLKQLIDEVQNISVEDSGPPKIGVQERIKRQVMEFSGQIEEQVDLFMENLDYTFDAFEMVRAENFPAIHTKRLIEHYTKARSELLEAKNKTCPQLVESYAYLGASGLKKFIAFYDNMIKDFEKWYEIAKLESRTHRKPRKKKVKSPEVLTKKVKFLEVFDDLSLKSVPPKMIVGAQQLWVYNTKTRFLGVYTCNNPHGLTVKGSTLLNFDEKESVCKKVRKPTDVIPKIVTGGKTTCKNTLSKIRAKEKALNGRLNRDTILIKVL